MIILYIIVCYSMELLLGLFMGFGSHGKIGDRQFLAPEYRYASKIWIFSKESDEGKVLKMGVMGMIL